MNNSRRKWNIRQTKARKAAKEFYAMYRHSNSRYRMSRKAHNFIDTWIIERAVNK